MSYVVIVVTLSLVISACLWLAFGPGPRLARASRRARKLLARGAWSDALAIVHQLQSSGGLSLLWQKYLRILAGDCYQVAADLALKEQRFEESLEYARQAAELLGLDEARQRDRVVEHMLTEARRLFSEQKTDAVIQLVQRAFAIQAPCPEGSFWLGLCQVQKGDIDAAIALLTAARDKSGKQYLDPGFYLGVLLHRSDRPREALRYLAEARRVAGNCPFVTWQMGLSLVAAGIDPGLAIRTLKQATGTRGLGKWLETPERAWVEAFPEGRSYVRRLAEHNPYVCPVLGNDLESLLRQGQLALAQAFYRQGEFQESADLFNKLLQEMPPTIPLLRGLGFALARLQNYDQAYKHLRIALEEEQPKDPLTASYLALCGALAKPAQPEDKPKNVSWALRLLARYPLAGDAEWIGLFATVQGEARAIDLPIGVEDQVLLCDAFASVKSTNAAAVAAYRHLAATFPAAIKPLHAWLFARAAACGTAAGPGDARDLELFACVFSDSGAASGFFEQQGWSFADAEYAFLERAAVLAPGRFPEVLGLDYAPRGERFLLERSRLAEKAGDDEAARTAAETLLRLAPQNPTAYDHLARLLYQNGEKGRAAELLTGWQRLAPHDHQPLVRQAILEQERGNSVRRVKMIEQALVLTHGSLHAAIAFLGARLALRQNNQEIAPDSGGNSTANQFSSSRFAEARQLLERCLHVDPHHVEALWYLAAMRATTSDQNRLAALATTMDDPTVRDARFHLLGAVCCLAANDYGRALELSHRVVAVDASFSGEAYYLMAQVYLNRMDEPAAREALQLATAGNGPSAPYAQAILGRLCFVAGEHDEAVRWWRQVDSRHPIAREVAEPLRQAMLLAGLDNYSSSRYEEAAEQFREAGRLGLRDRRLGSLLTLAVVQAVRQLLYEDAPK